MTEGYACDIVPSFLLLSAPSMVHHPLSYDRPCEYHDAHVKTFEDRKRLEEVLRIHDGYSHFSRNESLVLEVLRERGALKGSEINNAILSSGLADSFANKQIHVLLSRLQTKGWVVADKRNGRATKYMLTEKAEFAFRAWKLIGKEFMNT